MHELLRTNEGLEASKTNNIELSSSVPLVCLLKIIMERLSRVFSGSPKPITQRETKEAEAPKETRATPAVTKNILEERSVDEARPLRVIVIGAGISGILACIRFVQRIPNIDICIYDKNVDIGGTWFENRYPGCACGMLTFHLLPSHRTIHH